MASHYETLGISSSATAEEIRRAFRQMALKHHPDRSSSSASQAKFLAAKEAYDVLIDPVRRESYDSTQRSRAAYEAEKAQPKPRPAPAPPTPPKPASGPISVKMQRLASLFSRGQQASAEALAREILQQDPRQAMPYAVLGDIARGRGDLNEACRMYAYAAQFDATNPLYARRYEELLESAMVVTNRRGAQMVAGPSNSTGGLVGLGISALLGVGVAALSFDGAVLLAGLLAALAGFILGISFSLSNLVDPAESVMVTPGQRGNMRLGPSGFLFVLGFANFWLSAGVGVVQFLVQQTANRSLARSFAAVAAVALVFILFGQVSGAVPLPVGWLWLGNVVLFGHLLGWILADGFRRP